MNARPASADGHRARVGPPPPLDAELKAALEPYAEFLAPAMTADMIPLLRRPNPMFPTASDDELSRGGAFSVEERTVPGPDQSSAISLLICRPTGVEQPAATVYYTHGGGMVCLGIEEVLDWAAELSLAVVSVEYRLAPETRHPGPVEDVYAGLDWIVTHARELGVPARVVIAGLSAGGGLTAALALLCRDRGGPEPVGQMLLCPMLDDRNNTASADQMAGIGNWDRTSNEMGWTALLGPDRGSPDLSPYAAPARSTDLSGLPPAFIDVGSAETFRDEAQTYAGRIWAAGGDAELHVWPGAFHGFDQMVRQARISRDARAARMRWLRRLLAR